jgi:hypothetical protein
MKGRDGKEWPIPATSTIDLQQGINNIERTTSPT